MWCLQSVNSFTIHVNAFVGMFLQLKPLLGVVAQQIPDLFVVYLQVGRVDKVLDVFNQRDGLEDVLEGPRDDSSLRRRILDALHWEALATSGLPVSEHRAVVTFQHSLPSL